MRPSLALLACLFFISFATYAQTSRNPEEARAAKAEGDALYSQGKHKEALLAYQKATTLDPAYLDAWDALGNLHYEQGSYDKAIAAYQSGVSADASYTLGLYNIAFCYGILGQHAKAAEFYRAYLAKVPGDADALYGLGSALLKSGDKEKAAGALKDYLAKETRPEKAARVAEVKKQLETLQSELQPPAPPTPPPTSASAAPPDASPAPQTESPKDRARALKQEGDALFSQNKLSAAAEAYRKATLLDPDYLDAWDALGNTFVEQEEYTRAIEAYRAGLLADGSYVLAYYNIAYCYRALGKFSEAVASYQTYLFYVPDDPDALYGLAAALAGAGDTQGAIAMYENYIAKETRAENAHFIKEAKQEIERLKAPEGQPTKDPAEPSPPAVLPAWTGPLPSTVREAIAQGDAAFQEKEYAAAERAYAQAVALSGGNLEAHYKLGVTLALLRRYSEAIEHLSRALEGDPKNKEIRARLDRVKELAKAQDKDSTLATLSFSAEEEKREAGERYMKEGRYAMALSAFEEALGFAPKDAGLHKRKGDALLLLGRIGEAQESYLYALSLAPRDPAPYRALGDLYRLRGETRQARYYYELFLLRANPPQTLPEEIAAIRAYLGK